MFKWFASVFGNSKADKAHALKDQGNTQLDAQDYAAAESSYRQALAVDPGYAQAWSNLGLALKYQRRMPESKAAFESAVVIDTSLERAWYHLGTIAAFEGDTERAIALFRRAIALDPSFTTCYQDMALLQFTNGDTAGAEDTLLEGIAFDPACAALYLDLGNVYLRMDRFNESFNALTKGLEMTEETEEGWYWDARVNLGVAMSNTGRLDEAEELFNDMIAKFPNVGTLYSDLGMVMLEKGRKEEAAKLFLVSMEKDPAYREAANNYAFTMQQLGDKDAAATYYRQVMEAHPDWSVVQCNYGTLLQEMNRLDEARNQYERAVAIDPDDHKARFNLSLVLLLQGDFARGWKEYEARWFGNEMKKTRRSFDQPRWLGDTSLEGKTLFIPMEQGYGDVIQFIRFAEPLVKAGVKIILEVPEALAELCKSLPFASGVAAFAIFGKPFSQHFDVYCPMMSLPLALGMTSADDIPCAGPYLAAPRLRVAHWADEMRGAGKKIGVVWSGNPKHTNDRNRSMPLETFAPLFDTDGAEFFVLQQEVRAADLPHLPVRPNVHNLGKHLTDFAETAAVIENLDLVITVDTAVAHLAAALGKPVWVMLPTVPDFRWLLQRDDSPWYRAVKLYRQPEIGNWHSVIEEVRQGLAALP